MSNTLLNKTHEELWAECLRIIADNVTAEQFKAWFDPIRSLGYDASKHLLHLWVPAEFFKEQLEQIYLPLLGKTLRRVYGPEVQLVLRGIVSERPDRIEPNFSFF